MKSMIVVILGISFLASCKMQELVEEEMLETIGPDPRIVTGTTVRDLYSADLSDTTELHIDYSFFSRQFSSYVMDSVFKDSVNAIVRDIVQWETMTDAAIFNQPLTRHFFEAQLDSVARIWEGEKEVESNPWEINVSIGIQDHLTFVELTTSGWSYTGGAHGNGFNMYYLINKADGENLMLEDFFTDVEALNSIAETYFRKLFDLNETESLNDYGFWFEEDKFSVNENFKFYGGEVEFYYNSYEIAPYSGGPTELLVPMKEIEHLIK